MQQSTTATLTRLLQSARYEVLPTATSEEKVLSHVPRDLAVTVTASSGRGLEATLVLTEILSRHGYACVPHLAARMISGRAELAEIVARLQAAGVTAVFVPGGDADPAGDYHDALSVLEDLADLGDPFPQVGITGYPESHPLIRDDVLVQAMWDKRHHATHIVSNLSFSPAVLRAWIDRLRARGVVLPVLLRVPGPIDRAKLLAMATKIGVGESTRFLAKNAGIFARLVAPGGFTGERYLTQCSSFLGPADGVTGLHIYTFNQIAETEAWRSALLQRLTSRPPR